MLCRRYLENGRYPPHVDEAWAQVLTHRAEQGEQGDTKAEGEQQELQQEDDWKQNNQNWIVVQQPAKEYICK